MLRIARTETAPAIDGALDEPVWAQAPVISGLTGQQQGVGLDIVPSVVASQSEDFETGTTDSEADPSLDVFYNFTPSLEGVLTLNTDFSATEVDDRQINLTRFSLFFPEKRDFFLQDVDIFSFGGLERNGIPFHSRRIGLGDNGQPVDLEVGAKVTGRVGRWNVGVLDIQQEGFNDVEDSNLFVGRVSANVLEESSVGMILTHGDPQGNLDNSLFGADFRYRNTRLPGDRTLEGELWFQQSDTEGVDDDDSAWGLRIASPNGEGLQGEIAYDTFSENFNPALGFVNRSGIERTVSEIGYSYRPDFHRWIRSIQTGLNLENFDRISGGLESRGIFLELFEVETHTGGDFTTRLIQVEANYAFDIRWSWVNPIRYDNESDSVGINSRLQWNPRAGRDLYIVVNHGFDAIGVFSGLRSTESQLSVKYTQTFRSSPMTTSYC